MSKAMPIFDPKSIMKNFGDLNSKLIKGTEMLSDINEIDVGTAPKELVYEEDKIQLFHYKSDKKPSNKTPVLIVYALVNRYYMLDIQPDRSFIRNLLDQGLDLYIIDWGYPTQMDRYLSMDDYINGYLNNCVDVIRQDANTEKVSLMGICQGGTFSTIYSALYPEKVKNLVTLVAPFDFSTNEGLLFNWSKHLDIDALVDNYGVIPGDLMNVGFLMLMPFNLNIKKYVDMLELIDDKDKLLNFLRMEKWIFDSPGQAGECIRQFIKDCYQGNKLIENKLVVGDKKVDLKNINMPLLNIFASGDHLVPPAATKPLNDVVGSQDKTLYEFQGGHIGVFVGSRSQKELAPAIYKWLNERDATSGVKIENKSKSNQTKKGQGEKK
ncbi:MAG: class III poly(R)-hydroxyalkanoic acid synthase subunit PhaC [Nitrosomonadales bacterium]|jgi:polyhydroxyalkanoate synthase